MREKVDITPAKEFGLIYYGNLFHEIASRLDNRLMLDDLDIPVVNLPIGGSHNLSMIRNYLPSVINYLEEISYFKNWGENSKQILGAKDIAIEDIWLNFFGDLDRMRQSNINEGKLMLVSHAVCTLEYLTSRRRVSQDTFGFSKGEFKATKGESVWLNELTETSIPKILGGIHETTENMIMSGETIEHSPKYDKRMNAVHFFELGYKIFSDIYPANHDSVDAKSISVN